MKRSLLAPLAEPALVHPVLILESDDWGAEAPSRVPAQAQALERLAALLSAVRDSTGRPAVMTIGLVSGILDRNRWRTESRYSRLTVADPTQRPWLDVLKRGMEAGVFAIQWHGLEHYWPQALLAARSRPEVAAWLAGDAPTEALPPPLQSRWVDASGGASRAHAGADIAAAVEEEKRVLLEVFGHVPTVAVPNTFVWDDRVETAWRAAGVRFVVTCGRRYLGRDAAGGLLPEPRVFYNGEQAATGVYYLVRDVYFEPARGHSSNRLLASLRMRVREGRPCLVETHRANYLGPGAEAAHEALGVALHGALASEPGLRFMSTGELGERFVARDPAWVRTARPRELLARWGRRHP